MSWAYMYVMGFFFIAYTYKFNKPLLRVQWKTLAKWSAFLVLIAIVRYFLYELIVVEYFKEFAQNIKAMSYMPWYFMVLAGFEEAMFTLPIYYAMKYSDNRFVRAILMASLAAVFAFGHMYQGAIALIPTFLYMFYIAPRFMGIIGFGTMVLAHILYDLSVWGLIQILTTPDFFKNLLHSCQVM